MWEPVPTKGPKELGFLIILILRKEVCEGAMWCSVVEGGGGGYQVAAGHCEREGSGFEQEASSSGAPPAPRQQLAVSLDKANKYCPPRLPDILSCRAQPFTRQ
jgi:hypothetical protein